LLAKYRLELRRQLVRPPGVSSLCCGFEEERCAYFKLRTLALCTYHTDASHPVRSQVAYCWHSSDVLYSGVCGAGGESPCSFTADPDALWAREASTASRHHRCYLNAGWGDGDEWSGWPMSVRCVVALDKKAASKTFTPKF